MDTTRTSLLVAIKDVGNQKKWGEFYDKYAPFAKAIAGDREMGLRADEVEEVVLAVFTEIAQGKLRYDKGRGKFRSLLTTAVRNRARDKIRKRVRKEKKEVHQLPDDSRETPIVERVPDERADPKRKEEEEWRKAVQTVAVDQTAKRVSRPQFQIFSAAVLREWPTTRVMQTYGATEHQVYNAKSRVGKVYAEECRRAAAELDDPVLPGTGRAKDKPQTPES